MAEERVHFSREFIFQREGEFKREEFLKEQLENLRGRGEVCPGYLTSAFLTPPNGCLDQLGPMLERLLLCCSTQLIN